MTALETAGELNEQQHRADAVRCLSIPLDGCTLLLPYTAVAEVTEFGEPTPLTNGPAWLLGLIRWRGVPVPVLALEGLVGFGTDSPRARTEKVVVCNTLNGNPKLPFLAVAVSGIPRLTWAQQDALEEVEGSGAADQPGTLRQVKTPDGEVIIPDFDMLEQMLLRLGI